VINLFVVLAPYICANEGYKLLPPSFAWSHQYIESRTAIHVFVVASHSDCVCKALFLSADHPKHPGLVAVTAAPRHGSYSVLLHVSVTGPLRLPSLYMYMVTMLIVLLFRTFQPWKQWEGLTNSTTYFVPLKIVIFRSCRVRVLTLHTTFDCASINFNIINMFVCFFFILLFSLGGFSTKI
jgi:hypothetical protein